MTRKLMRVWGLPLSFVAGLLLLPLAGLADSVTMTFAGRANPGAEMGGVPDNPYYVTINGVQVLAVCDDYFGDWPPTDWTANEYTLDQVTATGPQKFTSASPDLANPDITYDYDAALFLASDLLSFNIPASSDPTDPYYWYGVYSYAIWTIFETNAMDAWGGMTQQEESDIMNVQNQAFATVMAPGWAGVSNVVIYTPDPTDASQEFLVDPVSEASALAILAVDLLALLGAVILARSWTSNRQANSRRFS